MIIRKQILSALAIGMLLYPAGAFALDNMKYCNAVQNRNGFVRYPMGTIGIWSTTTGELGDVMSRVPRIYPCVNSVAIKSTKDDWRSSATGDPSMLVTKYRADKPSGATTLAMTVSPHVSVFKVDFPKEEQNKYLVFDFSKTNIDSWSGLDKWTDRSVSRIDSTTFQASIGAPEGKHAYYLIKFSAPCAGFGIIDSSGKISDGVGDTKGASLGIYARFDDPAVTVAVAESFTSPDKARVFLATECSSFEKMQKGCYKAWNKVLSRVEIAGTENSKRMAYTALYSIYANIINADDGSCYADYCSHPTAVSSSTYWQFVGGYQNCSFDNSRVTYPFLMLAYPEVMSNVLGTYLARYKRDGVVCGDACLYTGPQGSKYNIRYTPNVAATAYSCGIHADYSALYAALKDNFGNTNCIAASLFERGHLVTTPDNGFACSRTLEFSGAAASMALLAKANNDLEKTQAYLRVSKSYTNLWDEQNKMFRLKKADESWGIISLTNWTWNPNPQGLFEGTSKDYAFDVPHDPFGLVNLPGQNDLVDRVTDYCLNNCWFNDYQYIYPYLLYYAGASGQAQRLIHNSWVPLFQDGVMYEGVNSKTPHNGWNDHYTSNSGWLLCSMLGLYPVPAPPGQFIISSPSIAKAVIHDGDKDIKIEAVHATGDNIYVQSITIDGKVYPCYMISAKRLASGADIKLEMGSDPARGLGDLYVAASDGFVLDAELITASDLKCVIESPAGEVTTKLHSKTKPAKVIINGQPSGDWHYDEVGKSLTIQGSDKMTIEVLM